MTLRKLSVFVCAFASLVLSAGPIARVNKISDFSKVNWKEAVEITGFSRVVTMDPGKESTSLRLLHDGTWLYGKIDAVQANCSKITGSSTRDDETLWKNNGVELFFGSDPKAVKQVILNTEGTVCDLARKNGKTDYGWNAVEVLEKKKTADSWSLVFRIPLKELPVTKGTIAFNIVRDNYEKQEFSSWAPMDKISWLQTKRYGKLNLDNDAVNRCGLSFDPVSTQGNGPVRFTYHATSAMQASARLYYGKNNVRKRLRLKPGDNELSLPYTVSKGSDQQTLSVSAGGKLLSWTTRTPRGEFLEVYAGKYYPVSGEKDLPTNLFWNGAHSMDGDRSCGNRVLADYEILLDVPAGIHVLKASKTVPSPRGSGRVVVSVPQTRAYCAPNWISTLFWSDLPDGTTGTIYYQAKWKDYLQKEQSFTFKVYRFSPVEPLKEMTVGFYNFYPRKLKQAEEVKKYGINTILYNGPDAAFARKLRENGFFVIRGGYFFPGGNKAFHKWAKEDPTAAAMDIDGKVIYAKAGVPQFSPSYRGKFFKEAVQKEREFALKSGITHFGFDMEGYIMPKAKTACFRPETIAAFEKWMKETHPEKKYISPFVFEKDPKKYLEYHRLWGDFKDWLFAGFFKEFKKQMALPDTMQSTPWKKGISISEWSLDISEDPENVHNRMRGQEFLKTFDFFETSSYSSADRGTRQYLRILDLARKIAPGLQSKIIACPSPARLDLDRNPENYYYSPAPVLEEELKYKIFDGAACGFKGIHLYAYPKMDALQWKNLTEAIRILRNVEHICVRGTFRTDLSCTQPLGLVKEVKLSGGKNVLKNQPKVLVKGVKLGRESLLAVSEYMDLKPVTVTVTCPVSAGADVFDAETGEKIAVIHPSSGKFDVKLDKRRCRLLRIVEK